MTRETEMTAPDDPLEAFVKRSAAGQRSASRYLANAFVDDTELIGRTVALFHDPRHLVRQGAAEALLQHAAENPEELGPYAAEIRLGLASDDAPFRTATLGILAALATDDPHAVEPCLGELADQLGRHQQFAATGFAAIAIGRFGASSTERAKLALPLLAGALGKKPKEALARELLNAIEELAASEPGETMRESIRDAVKPLIAHPNAMVRERSTKLYMSLA